MKSYVMRGELPMPPFTSVMWYAYGEPDYYGIYSGHLNLRDIRIHSVREETPTDVIQTTIDTATAKIASDMQQSMYPLLSSANQLLQQLYSDHQQNSLAQSQAQQFMSNVNLNMAQYQSQFNRSLVRIEPMKTKPCRMIAKQTTSWRWTSITLTVAGILIAFLSLFTAHWLLMIINLFLAAFNTRFWRKQVTHYRVATEAEVAKLEAEEAIQKEAEQEAETFFDELEHSRIKDEE